jgi:hypothetical protein
MALCALVLTVSLTDSTMAGDVVLNDGSVSGSEINSMMADTGLSRLYESRNRYSFWEFMDDQIHNLFGEGMGPDIYDDTGDIGVDEYVGISQPDTIDDGK